jgi:Bacterial pre-peptidase C-terminal domain
MPKDNNLTQARNIGSLAESKTFRDSVGRKDKNDYFTFTLSRRSNFSLNLSQLKENVDVAIIQGGQTILKSARPKNKKEAIATSLAAGTYYVRVYPGRNSSKYRLRLGASPVFSAFASRLLSTTAPEIGSVDPTTGAFLPLANTSTAYTDIASSQNGDLFGVSSNSLYQVDPSTGNSSLVGGLGTSVSMNALAFTPANQLFAAGGSGLYAINLSTGKASLVANIPGFSSSGDLLYDNATGRFFATSDNGSAKDSLYSIGLNGDGRLIGDIGFYNVWGLALNEGVLYGYTSNRLQITIDPATGVGTFDKAITGTVNQVYGAT